MNFEEALEKNPAPKCVGDAHIRLDSPVLLGEARRPRAWGLLMLAQALGAITGVLGAFFLLTVNPGVHIAWPTLMVALSALSVATASFVETRGRRRRFVLNFSTYTLRLDFSTPFRGMPQSFEIPFQDVVSLGVLEQKNGLKALVLEFRKDDKRLCEVLAADITARDEWALSRLKKILRNAFHLNERPTETPMSDSVFSD